MDRNTEYADVYPGEAAHLVGRARPLHEPRSSLSLPTRSLETALGEQDTRACSGNLGPGPAERPDFITAIESIIFLLAHRIFSRGGLGSCGHSVAVTCTSLWGLAAKSCRAWGVHDLSGARPFGVYGGWLDRFACNVCCRSACTNRGKFPLSILARCPIGV